MGDQFAESTSSTEDVAGRYLEAYLGSDFDTQVALLAPGAVFKDPTAAVYGPGSGQVLRGSEEIIARRRTTFANITSFDLDVSDSFVGNHHAVFMGTTKYTLRNGQRYAQPAVFVIEVREGLVTRHWDFVDYTVGAIGVNLLR